MQKEKIHVPVGTRDLVGQDLQIREYIIKIIKDCFQKTDAVEMQTPVIELETVVKNLYGEEFKKSVYKLNDSENLILRYDLTIPLARFIGQRGLRKFKRYQISQVYRRDNPEVSKGRYREFCQADFDIVGDDQNTSLYDCEILDLLVEILDKLLGAETYIVKLNDRRILYSLLNYCEIYEMVDIVYVSNMLDKLDKNSWDEIQRDLIQDSKSSSLVDGARGISTKSISLLNDIMIILSSETAFGERMLFLHEKSILFGETFIQFERIYRTLKKLGINTRFVFNPMLCRGLDYYTGLIFEVSYKNDAIIKSTIASGGRYDNMIGNFSNYGKIPAIGLSLGIERIAFILEQTMTFPESIPDVYIASVGENMSLERMILASELRKAGLKTSTSHLSFPKMREQFEEVFNKQIPFMIVIGDSEISSNTITIKNMTTNVSITLKRNHGIKFLQDNIAPHFINK
jgi:histidyl-tRNA synthetase